jgi:predicted permease
MENKSPFCFMIAGIFNERGISDLGRLVYHISLPALVFSNILTEVSKRLHSNTLLYNMCIYNITMMIL